MPGYTTNYSIPYPLLNETVDPAIFASFSTLVDSLVASLNSEISFAENRPWVAGTANSTPTIAGAAETKITWNTPTFDPYAMFSAGTPNQFTIPRNGLYIANVSDIEIQGFTTLVSYRVAFYQNGNLVYAERRNERGNSTASPNQNIIGLLNCLATDIIDVRILWSGTGGPAQVIDGKVMLLMISNPDQI